MQSTEQPTTTAERLRRWERPLLLLLVFFGGFANLAAEIIGPRLFASLFGSTYVVWAILISVTLVGLSIGYAWGGRVRDVRAALPSVLVVNAVWLILVSWIVWQIPVGAVAAGVGVDATLLFITATISFFVPSTLFGMLSPMVITLLTEDVPHERYSAVVGNVYALSTIGSVLGALAAAFLLIPWVGLTLSLRLFAVGLALFAVYFWAERRTLAAGLAAVLLIFPQPSFQWTDTEDLTLLGQREGYYQTIRVYESEEENFVQMHLGPTFQSKMDLETGEPLFSYAQRIVELIDEDMLDGQRALVIGGAGHVMSRYLAEHGAEVVEVEIDPLVVDFSTRFFGAVDAEIVIQDGRIYLETVEPDRFDLILIDAFDGAATVPPQLTTLEFFEAVDRALTSDGLMVYNFIGTPEGARSRSYHAMSRTVREALDHVGVTGTTEPTVDGERSRNILFFASPQPLDAYDLQAPPEDGFLLTDDRNPMDVFLMESRGWHYFRR